MNLWKRLLIAGLGLALMVGMQAFLGRSVALTLALLIVASASGCAMGALMGFTIARSSTGRALRMHWREVASRGVLTGATAGWGSVWICSLETGPEAFVLAAGAGAIGTFLHIALFRQVLSDAEQAFARAVEYIRKGDRDRARKALETYVACAKDDPVREARLPAAERFLAGEADTLVVATELEASSAPAGRGTEVTAAQAPAGRGTELVGDAEAAPEATAERTMHNHRQRTRG